MPLPEARRGGRNLTRLSPKGREAALTAALISLSPACRPDTLTTAVRVYIGFPEHSECSNTPIFTLVRLDELDSLSTMSDQTRDKLNTLQRLLPEGLIVDSAWMNDHGYYNSLRSRYVASGWLEQPARRVYRRPGGALTWQLVVQSLQNLLDSRLIVGGRTALEQQGYGHYAPRKDLEVQLYGPVKPPIWLDTLPLDVAFIYHKTDRLLDEAALYSTLDTNSGDLDERARAGIVSRPYGHWNWPLLFSTPERAFLELLDELPDRESFHQVDVTMEGLTSLRPRYLQRLLEDCRSIKVKRLFFFFADRHPQAWLKHIDRSRIDLGQGARALVKSGRYDPTYKITVPREF